MTALSESVNHPAHYGGADQKQCSSCEAIKSLADFPPDLRRKDGVGSKCRACAAAAAAAYYARYPEVEAIRRQANAEHGKAWYRRNRAEQVARMRWGRILKLYGLTQQDYDRLLTEQCGGCGICGAQDPGRKDKHFAIDHYHSTGRVRGLLCQRCNSGLGFFSDDPQRMEEAARYVRQRSCH